MKIVVFLYNQTCPCHGSDCGCTMFHVRLRVCGAKVCVCACMYTHMCTCRRTTTAIQMCEDVYMLIIIVPPMKLGKWPEIIKELSLSLSLSVSLCPSLSPLVKGHFLMFVQCHGDSLPLSLLIALSFPPVSCPLPPQPRISNHPNPIL